MKRKYADRFFTYQRGQHPRAGQHTLGTVGSRRALEQRCPQQPVQPLLKAIWLHQSKLQNTNACTLCFSHSTPGESSYRYLCKGANLYTYKVTHGSTVCKQRPELTPVPVSREAVNTPWSTRAQELSAATKNEAALSEPTGNNIQDTSSEKAQCRDFAGGPAVKNLSCNAGDAGSISGRGTKIPHATGQLTPRATTTEPTRHN